MSHPLITSAAKRRLAVPPYPIPTTAPYNVPVHLTTPTYEGSGNAVHPDVIDFHNLGRQSWGGYRYWMAHTPYPGSLAVHENPAILASHDGINWELPPGARDPLWPNEGLWNSDTDLVYDPDSDELVVIWRKRDFLPWTLRSPDGIDWPEVATPVTWTPIPSQAVSPAVVREPDGTWSMWCVSSPERETWMWRGAPTPEGPWPDQPLFCGYKIRPWHIDVQRVGGRYLALFTYGKENEAPQPIYAASSLDGQRWVENPVPILSPTTDGWDQRLYRATLQAHPHRGDLIQVWYSGQRGLGPTDSWHHGYTLIPSSEWPDP